MTREYQPDWLATSLEGHFEGTGSIPVEGAGVAPDRQALRRIKAKFPRRVKVEEVRLARGESLADQTQEPEKPHLAPRSIQISPDELSALQKLQLG